MRKLREMGPEQDAGADDWVLSNSSYFILRHKGQYASLNLGFLLGPSQKWAPDFGGNKDKVSKAVY